MGDSFSRYEKDSQRGVVHPLSARGSTFFPSVLWELSAKDRPTTRWRRGSEAASSTYYAQYTSRYADEKSLDQKEPVHEHVAERS